MFGASKPPKLKNTILSQKSLRSCKLYAHWITITIERLMTYLRVMVFFLITKALLEEKLCNEKIVKGLCDILHNKSEKLYIGNLYLKEIVTGKRYVYAM